MNQANKQLITLLLTTALASSAFAHIDHDDKSQRTWSDAEAQRIIEAAEEQTRKEKELAKKAAEKKSASEAELAEVDSENSKAQDGQDAKKAAESADMELKQ